MSHSRDAVEQALVSRYAIERELGAGAAATVFLARDVKHDRRVAVKVLSPELAAALGSERFLHEVRITAGLNHPNIMPLYDSGEAGGSLYYVMPAVEGETLRRKLAREGRLAVEEAVALTRALADAVGYAHGHGILHRDIKPENILLHHGVPLLADFGIAHAIGMAEGERLTASGASLGTPVYMSPEQAAGERALGPASDIYALASVLYEMLAGDPPFAGKNVQSILARILSEPPVPLRRIRRTVPAAVETAVERALAKTPADRFANAAEFAAALAMPTQSVSTGRTGEFAAPGEDAAAVRRGRAGTRRRVTATAAVAAVLLVLAAGRTWMTGRVGAELSARHLMVFPLVVTEEVAGSRSVGEDVATMIGNVLDNTGALRWVDGWALLDADQRDDPRGLTLGTARSLARAKRCAWFITGRVVARGDSVDVVLALHDVRGDSVVAYGSARGPNADAWRHGLKALNGILPALISGDRAHAVAEWSDRDPAATARFLLGEAAFRRAHIADASEHYRAAVAADSSFGVAAIRGALAATWNHRMSEAATLVQVALRQPLPARYVDIARGYDAFLGGRADSAVAAFRRVIADEPEMAVAWALLGEVYVHLLPVTTNPDSAAEAAFAAAHRLDPDAVLVLFHLIEARLRRGDVTTTPPLVRQFLAADPDPELAAEIEIMDACVRTPERVRWQHEAASRPFALLTSSVTLAGAGAQLPCAKRAFAALLQHDTAASAEADGRRWSALVGMATVLLAEGRSEEAAQQVDAFNERWGYGASLFLLAAPYIDAWAARAQEIARQDAERYGRSYAGVRFVTRLWELGVLEAKRGDAGIAEDVATELAARAARGGTQRDTLLARSAATHALLARGDTTRALQLLDDIGDAAVSSAELRWHEALPLGGERLTLARLLHKRGEHWRAIEVASVFDAPWPSIYLLYLPMSLELRASAAGALGESRLQSIYQSRLARLHAGVGPIAASNR